MRIMHTHVGACGAIWDPCKMKWQPGLTSVSTHEHRVYVHYIYIIYIYISYSIIHAYLSICIYVYVIYIYIYNNN